MVEKRLTSTARKLRGNLTNAETALWSNLRSRQLDSFKFVRQFPVGPHIVDFACRSARVVIELDGGQHSENASDLKRTKMIEAHGYHVIRFWNHDVLTNMEGVLHTIRAELMLANNR